jgi:hypothetical protein
MHDRNFRRRVISTAHRSREGFAEPQPQAAEKRRLLELGLGLGLAYIAFLGGWFWKTRGRPRGAGRVVRF